MGFPFMAAATALGAGLGFIGTRNANRASQASAREQMAFQERMSSTAYQRAMADMRESGLNPMLSSRLGGASTPGGAQYQAENELAEASSSAKGYSMMKAQISNLKAQNRNLDAQADLSNASAKKLAKETELLDLTRGREKFWSSVYDVPNSLLSSAKSFLGNSGIRYNSGPRSPDMPGDKHFGPIRIRKKR